MMYTEKYVYEVRKSMFYEVYGEVCFMKCREMYVLRNVRKSMFPEVYGDVCFTKCMEKYVS